MSQVDCNGALLWWSGDGTPRSRDFRRFVKPGELEVVLPAVVYQIAQNRPLGCHAWIKVEEDPRDVEEAPWDEERIQREFNRLSGNAQRT